MPEIRFIGDGDDVGRVHAAMVFPDSELEQDRYVAIKRLMAATSSMSDDAELAVSVKTLRLLLATSVHPDQKSAIVKRTKSGIIAGDLLSVLYVMHRFNLNPSMNRAIWVAQRYAEDGAAFGDGEKLPRGERQIREHWGAFEPVAHLWGAFEISRAYPFTSDGSVFSTPEAFPRFLGVAAELLRFGTAFVPKGSHTGKPVLNAERMFTLPANVEPLSLQPDEFPDRLKQLLADYKAPMPYR